ncbi:uncharacterized protein GIQ15_03665 [Arthroderma uncinatum]|uniref:uncharacterized protein n=1 Tax=Arthroderma uncinatum TaxID=74035 RepID=UPI00144AB7BB|nr:uncharacterized protein GIQ15_03665 [Arthroderma uncinatum]KAF3484341.1 hypothetical protein GIQ15_03665 [Arthroderma uncinatum]
MHLVSFIVLALLPELLFARVLYTRGIVCSFSTPCDPGDTCEDLSGRWGLTVDMFKSLNPGVNCPNLVAGQSYCVVGTISPDTPGTTTTSKTTTSKATSQAATKPTTTPTKTTTTTQKMPTTTSADPHSPTQPGLVKDCDKFHLVVSSDSCYTIEVKYGVSAAQFTTWNPSINAECSNLWLDYYVYVHVPGAITSVPMPTLTPTGPQPQMPSIAVGITLAQFRS